MPLKRGRHKVAHCRLGYLEIPQSLGTLWSKWKSLRTKPAKRISIQKHRCVLCLPETPAGKLSSCCLSPSSLCSHESSLFSGACRGLAPLQRPFQHLHFSAHQRPATSLIYRITQPSTAKQGIQYDGTFHMVSLMEKVHPSSCLFFWKISGKMPSKVLSALQV